MRQPIVTAINGDCMGLGASMALMPDYVRVGLVAGDGGAAIWPLLVGLSKAREALMFGKLYTAGEAKEMGLVNEVVPREQVAEVASATRLAEGAPLAIQWTKLSLNKILKQVVEATKDAVGLLGLLADKHAASLGKLSKQLSSDGTKAKAAKIGDAKRVRKNANGS